jgi:5-methylcytosine-specific restriction endonuclease McrA
MLSKTWYNNIIRLTENFERKVGFTMILELPRKFNSPYVEVTKDGVLKIYQNIRFEDLMYELTYALKKKRCVYCNVKLKRNNSTLDHGFPRSTGGISITNNLFPTCISCNSSKSDFTHFEFLQVLSCDSKKEKKVAIQEIRRRTEILKRKIGFKLPRKWVTFQFVDKIHYYKPAQELRGKKYNKIVRFYNQYKKIPIPIIVDRNWKLLDGFNVILFAKDFNIKKIPVIRLENVELVD